MKLGTITKVSIENLIAQMEQIENNANPKIDLSPVEPGQIAVVAVSPGVGLSKIFASLGVSAIVSGGQTMNPSTEEILHSFEDLPTEKIIILPNNKNIVMAAQSTQAMTVKNVKVVPSTSIPQGLSAMLRLNPDGDLDKTFAEMSEALTEVETGEITVATRSVEINGVHVNEGQVIALHNGRLIDSTDSLEGACLSLLKKAGTDEKERITFFYGNNVTKNQVKDIVDVVRSEYPDHEIEVHEGGQPHYQFIIAIE